MRGFPFYYLGIGTVVLYSLTTINKLKRTEQLSRSPDRLTTSWIAMPVNVRNMYEGRGI